MLQELQHGLAAWGWDLVTARPQFNNAGGGHRLVPQPGGLLLFPVWLWHDVKPRRCQEHKIGIGLNVGMRPVAGNAVG